ncbi:hypothetical protein DOS63_08280 [Staphylococcus felis]|uniref:fibronectin-binding protein FnbA n=1 Tax=Staphylococcus felis TaxID=46127 RepID=UPI000E3AD69F|nr:fibrinogen-binding adhesin SdrG C-terminal domain-containing protein [Staphylococcus felis]REH83500.1 hypothetical protein DOS63_08280 [Staphylococcus felis]
MKKVDNNQKFSISKYKLGAAPLLCTAGAMFTIVMGENNEAKASELATETIGIEQRKIITNAKEININGTEDQNNVTSANQLENDASQHITSDSIETIPTVEETQDAVTHDNQDEIKAESQPNATLASTQPVDEVSPSEVSETTGNQLDEVKRNYSGKDVTDKVNVVSSSIKGQNNQTDINPHQAERITLEYEWNFNGDIKQGDYFDFNYSDNVDTKGISAHLKVPEIKENDNTIAYGEVLPQGLIRYTFTDYVNQKEKLTSRLSLNLFFRPEKVLNAGEQEVIVQLGKHETRNKFNIKYLNGVTTNQGVKINGRIDILDKEKNLLTHYAYINPDKKNMYSVSVTGNITSGNGSNTHQPNVKIYKYKGESRLPESVYADVENKNLFEDVTHQIDLSIYNNGSYKADFGNIDGLAYVIKYVNTYNKDAKELQHQTQLYGYHNNYYYYPYQLTWYNGVQLYANNASGSSKNKEVQPIFGKSEPYEVTFDTDTHTSYQADNPYEETYDSYPAVIISESGRDFGDSRYVFTEEVEDTTPILIEAQSGVDTGDSHYSVVEEVEDTLHIDTKENSYIDVNHYSDVVEFEEESNIDGGRINHNTDIIEFEENTTTGVVAGAVSDHTSVEDTMEYMIEDNLVDYEYHTVSPSATYYAEGVLEEIEENHNVDMIHMTEPVYVHGHVQGVIEELDENSMIDMLEYNLMNGDSGQIQGTIEEIEENHDVDYIESTKPENIQGSIENVVLDITENDLIQPEEETNNSQNLEEVDSFIEDVEEYDMIDLGFELNHNRGFHFNTIVSIDSELYQPLSQQDAHEVIDFDENTVNTIEGHNEANQTIIEDSTPHVIAQLDDPEMKKQSEAIQKINEQESMKLKSERKHNIVSHNNHDFAPKIINHHKIKEASLNNISIKSTLKDWHTESHNKNMAIKKTQANQKQEYKELPNTGSESVKSPALFGGLMILIGLVIFGRRKKMND